MLLDHADQALDIEDFDVCQDGVGVHYAFINPIDYSFVARLHQVSTSYESLFGEMRPGSA